MGTYFQKQAAADRLYKLAACARVVRRKRSINKYARFNHVTDADGVTHEVFTPFTGGLAGAALGALGGLGTAYLTKSDRKRRAAIIGALLGGTAGTMIPVAVNPARQFRAGVTLVGAVGALDPRRYIENGIWDPVYHPNKNQEAE